MKVKTSELEGVVFDWVVAQCEGYLIRFNSDFSLRVLDRDKLVIYDNFSPSSNWAQGGLIIKRERVGFWFDRYDEFDAALEIWVAQKYGQRKSWEGTTPLIAAMRCYVASKLGDEVEVPDSLINTD